MYPVPYFGTTRNRLDAPLSALASPRTSRGPLKRTLSADVLRDVATRLDQAHKAFQRRYPGTPAERQPIHVVYGGAHLFRVNTIHKLGEMALRSMDDYAQNFAAFAKALGLAGAETLPDSPDSVAAIVKSIEADATAARRENRPAWIAQTVYNRVREKLRREPVEDYRIDFEDGYGNRPNDEEDTDAATAAAEVAAAKNEGQLPAFIGIRVKPFTQDLRERSLRTLDIFITELADRTRGELPNPFCVTLPKVTLPDEVAALADICSRLEPMLGLEPGVLRIEVMIEAPQAILNERGEANLLALASAARGRCVAAHFGPYDYTASRDIASVDQAIRHFASDFAREVMQVSLAGTGIRLADGPTNVMPIPPRRAKYGSQLTIRQTEENREAVHRAWRIHFENVSRSLAQGFYQGWDLHPAQLPARYAAVYAFFLENLEPAAERLKNFVEKAARATRVGQVFDDAAMAQGLLNYFRQAINCGALAASELQELTRLSAGQLRGGSFLKILEKRR